MADPSRASLQRRLGLFTATAVIMGITIGSGIFRVLFGSTYLLITRQA